MNHRLQQFLSAENITQAQLADTLSVARAGISHILAGRNKPGYDFISALMKHYPNLNIEWLMLGKGKMYKQDNSLFDISGNEISQVSDTLPKSEPAIEDVQAVDELTLEDDSPIAQSSSESKPIEKSLNISEINTLDKLLQTSVNQRKVSKIIVLFNDGSFQEL